jgi:hypothetical protein
MRAPLVARILGVAFLIAGILGFVPPLSAAPWLSVPAPFDADVVTLDQAYRFVFGVLPMNGVLDVLQLLFGVVGLAAGAGFRASVVYCRSIFWIYLVLAIVGAIPLTNTLLGIMPLFGWDVAFNVFVALLAAYGGYGAPSLESAAP